MKKSWKELEREVVGYLRTSLMMWMCSFSSRGREVKRVVDL